MKKQGKNAAAYAAKRLVLQETFLKLKIHSLYTRAASNREHTQCEWSVNCHWTGSD